MWMFPEEISEALASRDRDRIEAALQALVDHLDDMDVWPIAPPEIALLDPFGGQVPESAALNLLRIWEAWPDFEPRFPEARQHEAMIDLVGRASSSRLTYTVAVNLRISEDPEAIERAVKRIALTEPTSKAVSDAYFALLDHLLDGSPEVRKRTVKALSHYSWSPVVKDMLNAGLVHSLAEDERMGWYPP